MKVFFIDTNFFLQCRDYKEIPWKDIAVDASEILILISRPVQGEIDRLKNSGNNRRAKRARAANSFFRQIITNEKKELSFTKDEIKTIFLFSPLYHSDQLTIQNSILNMSKTDDRIIAEALLYQEKHKEDEIILLTHDTIPMVTAASCDLHYVPIPNSWLLPPENDDLSKRILHLEDENRKLRMPLPKVELSSEILGDCEIFKVDIYEELTPEEKGKIIEKLKERYPIYDFSDLKDQAMKEQKIEETFKLTYEPPTLKEIDEYIEKEYPRWIENIEKWLSNINWEFSQSSRYLWMMYKLKNNGNSPVENLEIEFKLLGNIQFASKEVIDNFQNFTRISPLPKPTEAPRGAWISQEKAIIPEVIKIARNHLSASSYPDLSSLAPPKRDRNAFYYKESWPYEAHSDKIIQCEEFRHQHEEKEFTFLLHLPTDLEESEIEKISCIITGKNLFKPIRDYRAIKIKYNRKSTFERVSEIIGKDE
ncbi:hypothetical protein KAI78_02080 [bacterium]|nr:hypothetical protein [bacterium]